MPSSGSVDAAPDSLTVERERTVLSGPALATGGRFTEAGLTVITTVSVAAWLALSRTVSWKVNGVGAVTFGAVKVADTELALVSVMPVPPVRVQA
jgi:hypothetical protein